MKQRNTKTITVSVPREEFIKLERLAREERKSKSQLFRDMLFIYEEEKREKELEELLRYGKETAKRLGIKSEADIERLVHEARGIKE